MMFSSSVCCPVEMGFVSAKIRFAFSKDEDKTATGRQHLLSAGFEYTERVVG